jgi:broad specificity phosphatase PhoE
VDLPPLKWSTAKDAQKYKHQYNIAPIVPFKPKHVLSKLKGTNLTDTIYCSPLPRSQHTAAILFGSKPTYVVKEVLREIDYKIIPIPLVKLPAGIWFGASRLVSMIEMQEEKQAVAEWGKWIEQKTKSKDIIIVGHGFQIRETIRFLKKRNWKIIRKEAYRNLSVNCLENQNISHHGSK